MGKVFKALEKSGIDASILGDEGQLGKKSETFQANDVPDQDEGHQQFGEPEQPDVQEQSIDDEVKEEPSLSEATQPHTKKGKQSGPWDERLVKVTTFGSVEAELFRTLRSKILYPSDGRPVPRTIMVTSTAPSEGKGFVAANLGISLAQGMDQHSLLVDCDLRRPSLARMFGLSNEFGLVNCLQEEKGVNQLLQKTTIDKLNLLASGKAPANPSELLGSSRMEKLINELAERYEDRFIIFDSAPGQVASESFVLARRVDAVVLVVRYGKSNRNNVQQLVDSIGRDKIVGIVFNGVKTSMLEKKVFGEYDTYGEYYSTDDT